MQNHVESPSGEIPGDSPDNHQGITLITHNSGINPGEVPELIRCHQGKTRIYHGMLSEV